MSTNYIDQITDTAGTTHDISEGDSTRIFRATCSTAASTAAKVATLDTSNRNFSLATGVRVAVTFKYGNSATTPTLRVDGSSTGTAKTIAFSTGASTQVTGAGTTYNTWGPYETVIFTYDGVYWVNAGSALGIYNAYSLANSKGTVTGMTTTAGTHTAGSQTVSNGIITTNIPTKTSHLTNDSGFITSYTDENMKWTASTSSNTYYPLQSTSTATTSTANTLNGVSFYQYYNTTGGYRRFDLGNSTAWKSTGGAYGTIRLYGAAATYYGDLVPGVLGTTSGDGHISANRTWTLPDKTGTIALTSDIPDVSSFITSDSDEKLKVAEITTSATYYPVLSSATTAAETKLYTNLFEFNRSSAAEVYFGVGKLNTTLGKIRLYTASSGGRYGIITPDTLTGTRTWTLPDKTGTIALTSDIPDVSGFITSDSDEKVKVAAGSLTGTDYFPVLATEAGTATRQYLSTIHFLGDSSYGTQFILGKSDGTSQGLIQLWSKTSGYYVSISPENTLTASRGLTLPDKGGTIALIEDIPSITFTQTLTEGTEIGKININGTNTSIYSKDPIWVTKISNTSITATSANTWFYTNQSIAVPAGHIYLVQVYVNYSNTRCLGLGMHTASTFSQYYNSPFYHMVSASSNDHLGVASFMLNGGTTWYCWLKYAGANSNTVYIRYLDFPFST